MEINIEKSSRTGAPCLIVLYGAHDDRQKLSACLKDQGDLASFAYVKVPDWNRDLSPWAAPAVFGNEDFAGGADAFLDELVSQGLPYICGQLEGAPPWYGIAGYSMAGLFSVYSLYRTGAFARAASASGSVWFDGFPEFAVSHPFAGRPDRVYFSVGDTESRTRDQRMARTEEAARALCGHYHDLGLDTVFELNSGGHFDHPDERLAKGIKWLISEEMIK